jgi:glycogen operon protein
MELVLFDRADDSGPSHVIALDPVLHRTSHYWHIFLPGIKPGQLYGYRADGPNPDFSPAKWKGR